VIDNLEIQDNLTAVDDENNLPDKFTLSQNYPNPFNPSTNIDYTVPTNSSDQLVVIKIYDIQGKEVDVLVNHNQKPGQYTINYNAGSLSSGIYFYRLESADIRISRKFVLLK
jgi:hypothetical protein